MSKLKNIVLIEEVFAHLRNAGKLLNSRGWKAFRLKLLVSWGTTNPHALNAGDECVSFFNVIQNPKLEETFNSSSIRWSSAVLRILPSACKFRFDAYPREKKIASSWLIRKAWSDFTFSQPVARMHGGGGKGELPAWQGPVEKLRVSRMPEASRPN